MVPVTTWKDSSIIWAPGLIIWSHLHLLPLFLLAPQSPIDLPFEISLNILSSPPPQPHVLLRPHHITPCLLPDSTSWNPFIFLSQLCLLDQFLPKLPHLAFGHLIHLSFSSTTTCLSSATLPLSATRPGSLLFLQHTPCIKAMRSHQHSTSLLEGPALPAICVGASFKTTS